MLGIAGTRARDRRLIGTTRKPRRSFSRWLLAGVLVGALGVGIALTAFATAGEVVWTRQFGTSGQDLGFGVAVDGTGVYVTGATTGTFPGETSAGSTDVFVSKYDLDGAVVWTRQFGTSSDDGGFGVAVDGNGVYVTGFTQDALPGQTPAGSADVFVRKYDPAGAVAWTRQFGGNSSDFGHGVAVDGNGVYVTGRTDGALPGQTSAGSTDAFVVKIEGSSGPCVTSSPPPSSDWIVLSPCGTSSSLADPVVYDRAGNRIIGVGLQDGSAKVHILTHANGIGGTPTWSQIDTAGTSPPHRTHHSAVYDQANNRVIVFGGGQFGGPFFNVLFNDVWVLTNANGIGGAPTWIQLAPTGTPPTPREGHRAVYDSISNRMIVFGGGNNGLMNVPSDVWVLTNANGIGGAPTWIQLLPDGSGPSRRERAAIAYDQTSNRMVLFGGCCPSVNDVWVLENANGVGGTPTWTAVTPTGVAPAPRGDIYTWGYDQEAETLIFYGGVFQPGAVQHNDVSLLRNAVASSGTPTWVERIADGSSGGPPPPAGRGVYDPDTNRLMSISAGTPAELYVLPNALPVDPVTADFDWTMPDRLLLEDDDGPVIFDHNDGEIYLAPGVEIDPVAGWRVDFDACASVDAARIDSYLWTIDGGALGLVEATACDEFSFYFPDEGEYEVSLTVVDEPTLESSTVVHTVDVRDFLIVSIGDSVASGEGNPDIPSSCLFGGSPPCDGPGNRQIPPVWQNSRCHRSAAAGPAQAAAALEDPNPPISEDSRKSSVTFIHLACSGATIHRGLLGKYDGVEELGFQFEPQLTRVIELTRGREIDALIVSIGANDIGFASIVKECVVDLLDFGDECVDEISEDLLTGGTRFGFLKKKDSLRTLDERFAELASCLSSSAALSGAECRLDEVLDVSAGRMIITGYHDPVRSGTDSYCSGILDFDGLGQGLSEAEAMWASDDLLRGLVSFTPGRGNARTKLHRGLNLTIGVAASRYGWTNVADVTEAFATHGYCTGDQRWIVTRTDAQTNGSGSFFGTGSPGVMHPNRAGHDEYARVLLLELAAGL